MASIYAMLQLFGERYIHCSDEQAVFDAQYNRESMVESYAAIMDYVRMKENEADQEQ